MYSIVNCWVIYEYWWWRIYVVHSMLLYAYSVLFCSWHYILSITTHTETKGPWRLFAVCQNRKVYHIHTMYVCGIFPECIIELGHLLFGEIHYNVKANCSKQLLLLPLHRWVLPGRQRVHSVRWLLIGPEWSRVVGPWLAIINYVSKYCLVVCVEVFTVTLVLKGRICHFKKWQIPAFHT